MIECKILEDGRMVGATVPAILCNYGKILILKTASGLFKISGWFKLVV